MNRASDRAVEAAATVVAALAAAFFGRWLFGYPSAPIAVLIAAVAAATSIALVELLDHDHSAEQASPPPPPRKPDSLHVPEAWWDQPPLASEPPRRDTPQATAMIDVRQWSRVTAERQYQCPTCGGFDIARRDRAAHQCNDCGSSWSWQPPSPWPRVTIDVAARSGVRR